MAKFKLYYNQGGPIWYKTRAVAPPLIQNGLWPMLMPLSYKVVAPP